MHTPQISPPKDSLKTKLLRSHLTIATWGLVGICLAVLAIWNLGSIAQNLASHSGPIAQASLRALYGIQASIAATHGWVSVGDQKFQAERIDAWQKKVHPALDELLRFSAKYPEENTVMKLSNLKHQLADLEELQWWIMDVAQTPGNEPARNFFSLQVMPIDQSVQQLIQTMIMTEEKQVTLSKSTVSLHVLDDFRYHFNQSMRMLNYFLLDKNPLTKTGFFDQLRHAQSYLDQLQTQKKFLNTDQQQRSFKLKHELAAYVVLTDHVINMREKDDWNVAQALLSNDALPLARSLIQELNALSQQHQRKMLDDANHVSALRQLTMWTGVSLIFIMFFLTLYISRRSAKRLTQPIEALVEATVQLEEGQLKHDIKISTNDELGTLMYAFNHMRSALVLSQAQLHRSHQELQQVNLGLEKTVNNRTQEIRSLARFPRENPSPVMRVNLDNKLVYANPASAPLLAKAGFDIGYAVPERCAKHCMIARETGKLSQFKLQAAQQWFELSCSASPDQSNEINIFGHEITSRIRAEYDLVRLATVVEQSVESVLVTNSDGLIQYVNPAFEKISGYSAAEVIGKSSNVVKTDDHDAPYYQQMWETLNDGHAWHGSFTNRAKDGSQYDVSQTISPIFDDDGVINGYAAVQHDITEQRRSDLKVQHADRLESLGVLAGGIAHDFNNLLTAIMGNASLALHKTDVKDAAFKHLEAIEKASLSAADLCKQMLAYSGKGKFVIKAINLSEIVENMGKLIDVSLAKSVVLKYHLSQQLPAIEADIAQIQQIVLNLITNASEAIENKSGVIAMSTGVMHADRAYLDSCIGDEHLREGRYVCLEVSDTGCGMDQKIQKKIFDPFFTTKFTGRGLGMSAMLGIVRGHHGALKIYSETDQGTTIKIIFPISSEVVQVTDQTVKQSAWQSSGTAMIIDDEETVREVASVMLEDLGFDVITANDGQAGVELFRQYQGQVDLVLLDMTMPKMNGQSCFRELRRIQADVRVILSSGYNEQDATHRFSGKGLAGFLQKPYSAKQLTEKVKEILHD